MPKSIVINNNKAKNIIKVGMKVLLDIGVIMDSAIDNAVLTLSSSVEKVFDDGTLLIQMPMNKGTYYPMYRNDRFTLRLFSENTMYNASAQFLKRVVLDNLVYANVELISPIRSGQMRSSYRLPCLLDIVLADLDEPEDGQVARMFEAKAVNLSTGGMQLVANENVKPGEDFILTINTGLTETLTAKVVRVEPGESSSRYKYKVGVKFENLDNEQQAKLYKYIINQQLEKRRQLNDKRPMYQNRRQK